MSIQIQGQSFQKKIRGQQGIIISPDSRGKVDVLLTSRRKDALSLFWSPCGRSSRSISSLKREHMHRYLLKYTCQIPCSASTILPQNGIQDLCASGSRFMQFHHGSCIASLFVSQLLNTVQNGVLTSKSLPVIYLGPPPLLGGRMLRSRRAGPLIAAAAAASPLPSRR